MSDRPLRVLLTLDAVGGVWEYGLDLARALGERGVESVVAVLGPEPDAGQRAAMFALPNVKLVETGLPLDWLSDGPAPVLAAGAAIARLAVEEGVDIVQHNMVTLGASAPPPMPVIAVTHGCVSTWWQAAKPQEPLAASFRWHRALMGEALRAADRVVAPSASFARNVARQYGLARTPTVVHNGRTPLTDSDTTAIADRALTVGRLWDSVKGAALLDRVAARTAVPFDAAGAVRGPHGETVALTYLNLLGRLEASDLATRLAARPVFVSGASFEPFGLAVLEAAAAGCALVLSDIPTFRELWEGAAIFVPHVDEAAYADAIDRLIADPPVRLAMGDAARSRAARYTPGVTADAMIAIYREAIATRLSGGKAAA